MLLCRALVPGSFEPLLDDGTRQGRVSDAFGLGEFLKRRQILLVQAQSNLLGARRLDLHIELFELIRKFFHTMRSPERALLFISFETRNLSRLLHRFAPLLRRHVR